jgi:hypothetical protein
MVEIEAYAADCRVFGKTDAGDGRLTDLLNGARELRIEDVRLKSLSDGHILEMPELTVGWDELYAVVAAGPRGESSRRVRTHVTRVEVALGPYHVEGELHGFPAGDALGMVLRRPTWVPLTNATIAYRREADEATDEVATLIVNRDLASSMRAVPGEAGGLRWEAVNPAGGGARAVERPRPVADEAAASGEPAPVVAVAVPPAAP